MKYYDFALAINLAELILSPGPLLRVSPSSGESPGMIDTVDDRPCGVGVPRAASKPRIPIVRGLPVGLIVLVKRHLLSCLVSGGNSNVNSEQSQS